MSALRFWIAFSLIFSLIFWKFSVPNNKEKSVVIGKFTIPLFFILAFVLRIVLSTKYAGFGADIACFSAWADRMADVGPAHFYAPNYFSDYPPLYLYVLYLIGLIKKTFHVQTYSAIHLILLKSPAILADLGIGYVIYKKGSKRLGLGHGICLSALFLFQPVVLMNSCLWGQIDSVFTFFLILSFLFLERQNLLPAMLIFGMNVLLKPQTLIFAPVMIVGVINYVYRGSFSMRMLIKAFAYALLTLIFAILLATPFGMENVLPQYIDTVNSYPYASVNAYNFWAGVGMNWHSQTELFCKMPCSAWGFIAIILATAFAIILGLRLGNLNEKYFVTGAFLILTVFNFSVRMHERYLYPMIPFLLLGFCGFASRQALALSAPGRKKDVSIDFSFSLKYGWPIASALLTTLNFANTAHVLFFYNSSEYDPGAAILRIVGLGMTIAVLFFYFILIRLQTREQMATSHSDSNIRLSKKALRIRDDDTRITRLDLLLMLFITILYASFALRDLGNLSAAQTVYHAEKFQTMTFNFPEGKKAASLSYYIAPKHDQLYKIGSGSSDNPTELSTNLYKLDTVFCWKTQPLLNPGNIVTMTAQEDDCNLIEIVFSEEDGTPLLPVNASEYAELFDEQGFLPDRTTFRNSTYFDEIYHARTAYEFLHDMRSYENTHPPFGKILISLGISMFGMTPFGWRIIGTLFGIAMLPLIYLFAKKLTGDTVSAALSCFIFAFDFMHFVQTRIATIDVYVVFFIICMYYFLFRFVCMDFTVAPMRKLLLPLALCGISMGFGVASKWTGVYAGLGMAIIFFGFLYLIFRRTKASLFSSPLGKKTLKLCGFCVIFFVAVPIIIYVLSYVPFRDGSDHGLLQRAMQNQVDMYSYHKNLKSTHYFSSPFYEWPTITQPIWYYSGIPSKTTREGISSFGNPLVWWIGIPAFIYMLYLSIRKKDKRALFLLIGYLAQYLPWFFVSRLTFIYHYFPSVIFLVLMIGYSFRNMKESLPKNAYVAATVTYALLVFGLFLMFYPVLSGQSVELSYVMKYLKWFKEWIFVSEAAI